jgi:hypothetical protein
MVLKSLFSDEFTTNRADARRSLLQLCSHLSQSDKYHHIVNPLISRISHEVRDDSKADLTDTLGQLCPYIGPSLVVNHVVDQLCALAEDSSSKVRRATVYGLIEAVRVVNSEKVLKKLFHRVKAMCSDGSVIVRNACADIIPDLFSSTLDTTIWDGLVTNYCELAKDESSRMVRKTAVMNSGYILAIIDCVDTDRMQTLINAYMSEEFLDREVSYSQAKFFGAVLRNRRCSTDLNWGTSDRKDGLDKVFHRLMFRPDVLWRRLCGL